MDVSMSGNLQVRQKRVTLMECNTRSEEHTSELQSQSNLVCRLLLEQKNSISVDPQLLFDLRGMPVAYGPAGAHHARSLGMVAVLARLSPTLARADLALDDNGPRAVDDIRLEERE